MTGKTTPTPLRSYMTVRALVTPGTAPVAAITTQAMTVDGGATVNLTGTVTDVDRDSTTQLWTASGGVLTRATTLSPTWTAPAAQASDRTYSISLVGNDGTVDSNTATVTMTVRAAIVPNVPPTVTINTAAQTVNGGATVALGATVADTDGSVVSQLWTNGGSFANGNAIDTVVDSPCSTSYPAKLRP